MNLPYKPLLLLSIFLFPFLSQAQTPSSDNSEHNKVTSLNNLALGEKLGFSQTNNSNSSDRFYLNGGYGIGSKSIAVLGSLSYQFSDANLLTLRTAHASGFAIFDSMNDVGLLYGRATNKRQYHASFSAGIALVRVSSTSIFDDDPLEAEDFSNKLGVPLQAELHWRPTQIIGFGLSGFANFNSTKTFAGLMLGLQVGKLR